MFATPERIRITLELSEQVSTARRKGQPYAGKEETRKEGRKYGSQQTQSTVEKQSRQLAHNLISLWEIHRHTHTNHWSAALHVENLVMLKMG